MQMGRTMDRALKTAYSASAVDSDVDLDAVVRKHARLVKNIAYHLQSRLPPNIQPDDLVQAGFIGLMEAAKNYDPSQGASFETYAGIRVRGSMLDEIRRSDWTPRSVHRKARMLAAAEIEVENETGQDALPREIAEKLRISLEEYYKIDQSVAKKNLFSLEQMINPKLETALSAFSEVARDSFKRDLAEAMARLPERERLVIALYYDEELNLREIGEVLGHTESRACQIHSQATLRLRSRLKDWLSVDSDPLEDTYLQAIPV